MLKLFEMDWNYPHAGGVDAKNVATLQEFAGKLKEDAQIADIGCWTGLSSIALAMAKPKGKIMAVDWFKGSPGTGLLNAAEDNDIRELLEARLRYFDIKNVEIVASTSKEVWQRVQDKHFDMVFIDADHRYEAVKWDIIHWFTKLQEGGILCGHDCEFIMQHPGEPSNLADPWNFFGTHNVNPWNKTDYVSMHYGVVKAVSEVLPFANQEHNIWWIRKNEESSRAINKAKNRGHIGPWDVYPGFRRYNRPVSGI